MKNQISFKNLLVAVLFIAGSFDALKAQLNCPYTIVNNLTCNIMIAWDAVDVRNQEVCHSTNCNVVISAGSTFFIPASCCGLPTVDIYVYVCDIFDGTNWLSSGQPQAVNGVLTSCTSCPYTSYPFGTTTGPCSTWRIDWYANRTEINP